MSFLAPLFLAGAAAIAFPFIFHLIRRSAKEKILFSSLMFLSPSPPRLTRRSRLEHLFLLFLRSLVVCLLALAFARPYLSKLMNPTPKTEGAVTLAVLLDRSASMQRENLWEQGKRIVMETVRGANPGTRIGVFTFGRRSNPVVTFLDSASMPSQEIPRVVQTRLDALEPTWESTHLGNAVIRAAELLADELNQEGREFGRGEIVVVSDLQTGAHLEGLQGYVWPKNVMVTFKGLKPKEISNAGIHLLENERRLAFAATNATVRVHVQNSARSKIDQFEVAWAIKGEAMGEGVRVYIPAGESRVISAPPHRGNATELILLNDHISFDNRAFLTPSIRRDISVLYHGKEDENDPSQPLYYLKRAFEQKDLALRVVRLEQSSPTNGVGLMVATAALDEKSLAVTKQILEDGKTFLLALQRPDAAQTLAPLIQVPSLVVEEARVKDYGLLGSIDFSHPFFKPFADARYSDFTKIHFWKYRTLGIANLSNSVVAAKFDSGDPFLVEIPVKRGKIIVFTSSWAPRDSQLALSSKFVPLLLGILEESIGAENTPKDYVVGDPVLLPGNITGPVRVISPDGQRQEVKDRHFNGTFLPGIYTVGEPEQYRFAVNLDPAESKTSALDIETFQTLGIPLTLEVDANESAKKYAVARQQHRMASETEARQKLWRNLLIGAFVVLLAEMWLAGRLSRSSAATA